MYAEYLDKLELEPKRRINDRTNGWIPVLRIRDVYPGSRILIFTHSGSRISDLGSRILDPAKRATKERSEKNLLSNLFL
jgi:hypothetical protein